MIIRFTSTLTADDESRFASALVSAVRHLLAAFPISYAIRVQTTAGEIVEDGGAGARPEPWAGPRSLFGRRADDTGTSVRSQP
jgi:hypothetical protein